MSRGEFLFHRNQNPQIETEPVIDRMFCHGWVRGANGIWAQEIGDECYPLNLNDPKEKQQNDALEKSYQQRKVKNEQTSHSI